MELKNRINRRVKWLRYRSEWYVPFVLNLKRLNRKWNECNHRCFLLNNLQLLLNEIDIHFLSFCSHSDWWNIIIPSAFLIQSVLWKVTKQRHWSNNVYKNRETSLIKSLCLFDLLPYVWKTVLRWWSRCIETKVW
jgi:hypothetical protein